MLIKGYNEGNEISKTEKVQEQHSISESHAKMARLLARISREDSMIINKNFKIESDELNVTLFKHSTKGEKAKKPGEECWTPIAFFSTPESTLNYLVKLEVMGTGMTDLRTVVQKIDELKIDIMKALR